jgi:hypothetical protein
MRKSLLLILCLFTLSILHSQENTENALLVDGKLYIDSIYSNKEEKIIYSGIHAFDELNQAELKKRVKNWASLNFVNLKEVLVSETDDQIVLNYITSAYYVKSLGIKYTYDWYIRLMIQFKDGKIKCTYFDDGNVRTLASQYAPAVAARSYYLKDVFKKQDDKFVCPKMNTAGIVNLYNSIKLSFNSIKLDVDKNALMKDDW